MNKNSTIFAGLDLGEKFSYITILDQDGELIEETRLPTTRASLQRKFSVLPVCRVAMEVGSHSRWVSHLLNHLGHDVLVANARKLRAIYHNPRKGDRADAETLARLARLDPKSAPSRGSATLPYSSQITASASRPGRAAFPGRSRTLLINHARGIVKASGARLPSCSADSFSHKAAPAFPQRLRRALLPILETIASLSQQIREFDKQVERLCQDRYPETKLLRPVSGVGPLTAPGYILTIENPHRFLRSREVGPALGLVPRRDHSGDKDPQLRTLAPALQVQASPQREMTTCGVCWLDRRNTSWVLLRQIATCAVGA